MEISRPYRQPWTLSRHARSQMVLKGFSNEDVIEAVLRPHHVTPVTRYPGQQRRVRNDVCVIVDMRTRVIVTVYRHGIITPLRPDQIRRGEQVTL